VVKYRDELSQYFPDAEVHARPDGGSKDLVELAIRSGGRQCSYLARTDDIGKAAINLRAWLEESAG
jgi:hypothetical protein